MKKNNNFQIWFLLKKMVSNHFLFSQNCTYLIFFYSIMQKEAAETSKEWTLPNLPLNQVKNPKEGGKDFWYSVKTK